MGPFVSLYVSIPKGENRSDVQMQDPCVQVVGHFTHSFTHETTPSRVAAASRIETGQQNNDESNSDGADEGGSILRSDSEPEDFEAVDVDGSGSCVPTDNDEGAIEGTPHNESDIKTWSGQSIDVSRRAIEEDVTFEDQVISLQVTSQEIPSKSTQSVRHLINTRVETDRIGDGRSWSGKKSFNDPFADLIAYRKSIDGTSTRMHVV